MNGHALFAPSSMARIVQCPGSVLLAAAYPEADDSPEAAEGTAAHWVMAAALEGSKLGDTAPNGVPVDDDMTEGAALVAEVVAGWGQPFHVEQHVSIARIHAEHCHGTPDVTTQTRVLDYKYGYGFVDVFENWQLMAYAAATTATLSPGADIELVIVQPRSYHRDGPVRSWKLKVRDLDPYVERMREACAQAMSADGAPTRTGPECKHCPARHACPRLQAEALDVADEVMSPMPLDLPVDAAARELHVLQRAAKLLEARMSGLEAQVSDACRRGQAVPYYHLEQTVGREQWAVPADQVIALGDALGVDVRAPKVLTPAQARKAGLPTDGFTDRPRGAAKLVPDGNRAARVFGG